MTDIQEQLNPLRQQIDQLDEQILELITKRAKCAVDVANIKRNAAAEQLKDVVFYRPEREAQILRKVMERNNSELPDEAMAGLFRQIISTCLALEQRLKIAYLGPQGTFTQTAALKHFGDAVETVSLNAIDEVFREVEAGASHYGVVPVENSSEGVVNTTLDNFLESNIRICGEVELRIHHHMLVSDIGKPDSITRIYSHQQSLAQCRKWIDAHWPNVERIAVNSNGEAARRIKGEWNAAAIAGETAANIYGLTKLHENIEDNPSNTTRFLIIGQQNVAPSGVDKTSIIVSMRNKPGALYHLLKPFDDHGVSLTRVETRPCKSGVWAYVFFIDFEGHESDPNVVKVLEEIEQQAVELKRLGSYPKAVL